jgi:hypothetical protein
MDIKSEATVPKNGDDVTHYLKDGQTPCPIAQEWGLPPGWPRNQVWSQRWSDVTCPECLTAKPESEAS